MFLGTTVFAVCAQLCIPPADFAPSAPVYLRAYVEDAAVSVQIVFEPLSCCKTHPALSVSNWGLSVPD